MQYFILKILRRFSFTRPLWDWYTTYLAKKAWNAMTPEEKARHQAQVDEMLNDNDLLSCPKECGRMVRRDDLRNYGECAPCFVGEDYWEWSEPEECCSSCGSTFWMWLYDPETEKRFMACENCSQEWVAWVPEPCMYCGSTHHPAKCDYNPWRNSKLSLDTDEPPF